MKRRKNSKQTENEGQQHVLGKEPSLLPRSLFLPHLEVKSTVLISLNRAIQSSLLAKPEYDRPFPSLHQRTGSKLAPIFRQVDKLSNSDYFHRLISATARFHSKNTPLIASSGLLRQDTITRLQSISTIRLPAILNVKVRVSGRNISRYAGTRTT